MVDILEMQRRLAKSGHYTARLDGIAGRLTYAALFENIGRRRLGETGRKLGEGAALHFSAHALDRPLQLAHFLAQTATETGGFAVLEENLRYSAQRMMQVFPTRFRTMAATAGLANNPRAFANCVYSNRLGNGPAECNDGYHYRGRGIIQLTGRTNYAIREAETGLPLLSNPDLASDPKTAVQIACLYWTSRSINIPSDRDDVVAVRRAVNGGTHGIDDTRSYLARAKAVVGVP